MGGEEGRKREYGGRDRRREEVKRGEKRWGGKRGMLLRNRVTQATSNILNCTSVLEDVHGLLPK